METGSVLVCFGCFHHCVLPVIKYQTPHIEKFHVRHAPKRAHCEIVLSSCQKACNEHLNPAIETHCACLKHLLWLVFRTPRNRLVDLCRHFLWKVKTWKPRKLQFNEIFSWWFLAQVLISLKSVFETSVQQLIREAEPRLVQTTCPGSGPNCLIWLVVGVSELWQSFVKMNLSSWTFTSLQQGLHLHSRFHLCPDIVIPGPHVQYLVPLWFFMYLSFIYSWAV